MSLAERIGHAGLVGQIVESRVRGAALIIPDRDDVRGWAEDAPEADPYEHWEPSEATDSQGFAPDVEIVPYVEALREAGVETAASCAGHYYADDGRERDLGYLWLEPDELDALDARRISLCGRWISVRREYGRYELWEVEFQGCATPDEPRQSLRAAMEPLFAVLGVELPPEDAADEWGDDR